MFTKAQRYISGMTENEKRARLNEIGWELALMYPERTGTIKFGVFDGKYKGVNYDDNLPPGQRPSGPIEKGY